jgi:hypothetical protein
MLASFDVVSLFIKVPTEDIVRLLLQNFKHRTISLSGELVTTT